MDARPEKIDLAALAERFADAFGREPGTAAVRAPGRVNLIGEHTDYNDGLVLPVAIEREIVALVRPRDDGRVRLRSTGAPGEAVVALDGEIAPGEPAWADYCRGVIAGLKGRGEKLAGADILFESTIPTGAGLSSSAALEVATALALQVAAGTVGAIEPRQLALLCQRAEHDFAGAPCGIMDQSIVIMGRRGHALLLDCRSGEVRHVPFDDGGVVLLICDTRVRHSIPGGEYARRRRECESAAAKLGVRALRDVTPQDVEDGARAKGLSAQEHKRARHVTSEIARTIRAAEVFGAGSGATGGGDYETFGRLMYASHASLRDDYEVSCPELDAIVEVARGCAGVFGARMTGGGFGGCAIVLAAAERAAAVAEALERGYAERFHRPCSVFATAAAAGASVVT